MKLSEEIRELIVRFATEKYNEGWSDAMNKEEGKSRTWVESDLEDFIFENYIHLY